MSFPTFPRKRKTCAPSPPRSPAMSVRQRQPRAPRLVLSAMESAPGCFPYPSTSLTRVPNTEAGRVPCGSRPRPARNPRRRSPPRITPAPGGWRGRGLGPARPAAPARRGAKRGGSPHRLACPGPRSRGRSRQAQESPNRALRLSARLPALPPQLPGRGEQAPGANAESAPARAAERRPFRFESSN